VPALPHDNLREGVNYPGGQESESGIGVSKVLGDLNLGGFHYVAIAPLGAKRIITFRGIPLFMPTSTLRRKWGLHRNKVRQRRIYDFLVDEQS
jgi:hypothetical protein